MTATIHFDRIDRINRIYWIKIKRNEILLKKIDIGITGSQFFCSYRKLDNFHQCNYDKIMEIEYDDKKRLTTLAERGLDFEDAPLIFECEQRITWTDNRYDYGEAREITVGKLAGRLIIVVHTKRGPATRIISMRKANEREQRWFEEQFTEG